MSGRPVPTGASMRARLSPRVVAIVAWAIVAGAVAAWALARDLGPADAARSLVDGLQGSAWGPVAFVALYLARPLLFFSASVLTVAGGFLFGAPLGLALVLLASNGSAMVAYGIARWLGAGRMEDPASDRRLARWARRIRARSFQSVITMRLLFLPFDLVSYLAGALRTHPAAFLAATAIGSIPATVALVLFGASLESFDGGVPRLDLRVLVASVLLMVVSLALAEVLRRREGAGHAAG